ncbi:PH domain-containing protein [Ralstonia pseudosolanacearum]|uniref:PH domain-containing protein n=1 Tax=Ralstonia solanacearum TaxID=305 RepID=A0ABY6NG16_RALSL|nr:PH domain-containing protein [Ralstonia solanacearum]
MGAFVNGSLIRGEEVQEVANITWLSQFWYLVLGVLSLPFGFGVFLLIVAVINVTSTELAVTNKKLIGKTGFIRRTSIDIPLQKIESLNVNQGIVGRMLGYGRISVRGTGGNQVSIPFIKNPLEFRKTVMNIMDENDGRRYAERAING